MPVGFGIKPPSSTTTPVPLVPKKGPPNNSGKVTTSAGKFGRAPTPGPAAPPSTKPTPRDTMLKVRANEISHNKPAPTHAFSSSADPQNTPSKPTGASHSSSKGSTRALTGSNASTGGLDLQGLLNASIQRQIAALHNQPNLPMDPTTYAQDAANSKYDAAIAEIKHQQAQSGAQTLQNQKDITDWYHQVEATQNTGADQFRTTIQQQLAGLGDASQGMSSALGGVANPAAGDMAANSQIALGGLAAQGNAGDIFNQEMKTIIPMQGAQAHVNEQGRAAKLANDLATQLTGQTQEKGAFYGTTLGDAQQKAFDDRMTRQTATFQGEQGLQNSLMGASMAGLNTQKAKLENKTLAGNIAYQKKQSDYLDSKVSALAGKGTLADPTVKSAMDNSITHAITGPRGGLAIDPQTAWSTVNGILARYGFTGPDASALASSIFSQALQFSHSHGQFLGTTIGADGKLHISGKSIPHK